MSIEPHAEVRRRKPRKATAAGAQSGSDTKDVQARQSGVVASTELARRINRDVVLELIRLHQPISRVDLGRASGLQNSTVSSIVEQLDKEGWIFEGEALKTARGRRPTQISLNDNLAMLAADIRPGRAVVAAVDLNGQLFGHQDLKLAGAVELSVMQLGDALATLRARHTERSFIGVGVCLPGRIQAETGRLVLAPNLHWRDYGIRETLANRLGLAVELENDANACLLSELWFGHLDGIRNCVLLAISEGVGASLLADGHLISGRRGLAGEFGHICVDPQGPQCECGRRGCWEVFASTRAARADYRRIVPGADELTYLELCSLADIGDKAALAALNRQAEAIGRGLRMVIAALAPEIILFAGDISYGWDLMLPVIEVECQRAFLAGTCPRLSCTGDGQRAHLLGAAAVVLQRRTDYYRSRSAARASNAQHAIRRQPFDNAAPNA